MSEKPLVTEDEYRDLLLAALDVDTDSDDPANEYTIPQLEKAMVAYGIAFPIVRRIKDEPFTDPAEAPASVSYLEPAAPVPNARTAAELPNAA